MRPENFDALEDRDHESLLGQLKHAAATSNGDVYVSIVPFVKDVNLGAGNYTAPCWIDWTGWDASNGTCSGFWRPLWPVGRRLTP